MAIQLEYLRLVSDGQQLTVGEDAGVWRLRGSRAADFALVNEFLVYLADRNFSPRTGRAYAYDLLAFTRWLIEVDMVLSDVDVDVLLRFLTACREATPQGRPGGNVYSIRDGRNTGYSPATINRRLAAISSLFAFREMREPGAASPVPRGRAARTRPGGERSGLLAHVGKPQPRSKLRVRDARRLPRGLSREESTELLGLRVADVDIARRWVRVNGKGGKERSVPIDTDVAGAIQTYLLVERPETDSTALFVVAKGAHRGQPLTPAGLRTVFRYHRERSGVSAGHPHALRHSFGTALAEAGVDLSVIQALMGHDHVDSSAAYIHLAPSFLREEFDAARARLRTRA